MKNLFSFLSIISILNSCVYSPALAALTVHDQNYTGSQNIAVNPSGENGIAGWTGVGATPVFSTATADLIPPATGAITWDSTAAAQTLTGTLVSFKGLAGLPGELTCYTRNASGTATHTLGLWDGTNNLYPTTIASGTSYQATTLNFTFPSGSGTWRFTSVASNEPNLGITKCFIGLSRTIGQVSQAQFIGSAYIAPTANCTWTRANTALGAFGTDADCPGPTVEENDGPGTIQTTDTDLPQFTVNALPAGRYAVQITGLGGNTGGGGGTNYAISDGTTTTGHGTGNSTDGASAEFHLVGNFLYTSAANRTFSVHGSAAANTNSLYNGTANGTGRLRITIYRFPLSSEFAQKASQTDYDWRPYTPVFTGLGTVTNIECQEARVSSDLKVRCKYTSGVGTATEARVGLPAGLTSANTSKIPSLQYVAKVVTNYSAAFDHIVSLLIEPSVTYFTLGFYSNGTSGLSKANGNTAVGVSGRTYSWTASIPIEGWQSNGRAPTLIGSITSNAASAYRVETARFGNTVSTACTSSPCGYLDESSDWISNVTRSGTGTYTVNIHSGIFSAIPRCFFVAGTSGGPKLCGSNDRPTLTTAPMICYTPGGVANDTEVDVMCIGPR